MESWDAKAITIFWHHLITFFINQKRKDRAHPSFYPPLRPVIAGLPILELSQLGHHSSGGWAMA